VAAQALRAFIAMKLVDRVLPQGNPPDHPLSPSNENQQKDYEEWLGTQRDEVFGRTNDQRQWVSKYVRDNITINSALALQKGELVRSTMQDIKDAISELYQDWDQSVSKNIQELVESALELSFDMMRRDLPIVAHWVEPGDKFNEDYMKMSDISIFEGTVGLCVFPLWADSEDFTILKAKVYCVS